MQVLAGKSIMVQSVEQDKLIIRTHSEFSYIPLISMTDVPSSMRATQHKSESMGDEVLYHHTWLCLGHLPGAFCQPMHLTHNLTHTLH